MFFFFLEKGKIIGKGKITVNDGIQTHPYPFLRDLKSAKMKTGHESGSGETGSS